MDSRFAFFTSVLIFLKSNEPTAALRFPINIRGKTPTLSVDKAVVKVALAHLLTVLLTPLCRAQTRGYICLFRILLAVQLRLLDTPLIPVYLETTDR